jgi:FK506-binding nuclear protein
MLPRYVIKGNLGFANKQKNLQQPLDLTLQDEEVVYFRVFGNRSIHLTGNFVIREHSGDSDDEEEDEEGDLLEDGGIYGPDGMYDSDDSDLEIDELDDIAEPRVTELEDDDEPPKLVKVGKAKGKGKRAAGDLDSDEVDAVLDKLLDVKEAKEVKAEPKSKHQAKKLKNNEGQAIAGTSTTNGETKKDGKAKAAAAPAEKKGAAVNGSAKKVQFAEKLEQGPTPSAPASKRVIKGVTIDDRKPGSGQAAKKGDRVAMRYIGKLKDGKMFDGMLLSSTIQC